MASTPGLIVRVSNASGQIGRVIHTPRIHMRPDADGLMMLHHGDADEAMERGESPHEWIGTFFERASSYVPGLCRCAAVAVVNRDQTDPCRWPDERRTGGRDSGLR